MRKPQSEKTPSSDSQTGQARIPDYLRFVKTLRIAVTGDIRLTGLEIDIIDTPDFQRLRGVRQLGSVLHVYPTALHTRFDHSLGSLAMAENIVQAIRDDNDQYKRDHPESCKLDDKQRALARLYALLHDITHVPFGHTIEDELKIFASHDADNSDRFEWFLGPDSKIGGLLQRDLFEGGYKRFEEIYKNGKNGKLSDGDEFIYHLVSDTVCADLLDYVRRDSHFCNLDINFDYRFLNYLYLGNIEDEDDGEQKSRIIVRLSKGERAIPRRDTLTDLTRLLEARYMIAERVYFHHAKIISGTMIGRAVYSAKKENKISEKDMCRHTDDTLVHYLANLEDSEPASSLAAAFRDRRLYKTAHVYTAEAFEQSQTQDHSIDILDETFSRLQEPESRSAIEDDIAADIGAEPGHVLIYAPNPKMNMKLAQMNVLWKGQIKKLHEIDDEVVQPRLETTLRAHKKLWGIHVLVHPDVNKNEKQVQAAQHAFEVRFIHGTGSGNSDAGIKELVRHYFSLNTYAGDMSVTNYEDAVDKVAQTIEEQIRQHRNFSVRESVNKVLTSTDAST